MAEIKPGTVLARDRTDKQNDPFTQKCVVDEVSDDFIVVKRYENHPHPRPQIIPRKNMSQLGWYVHD